MTRGILNQKIGDKVVLTRTEHFMVLSIMGDTQINMLQRVLDSHLNTRPESASWLYDLSDALNPSPVPARRKTGE